MDHIQREGVVPIADRMHDDQLAQLKHSFTSTGKNHPEHTLGQTFKVFETNSQYRQPVGQQLASWSQWGIAGGAPVGGATGSVCMPDKFHGVGRLERLSIEHWRTSLKQGGHVDRVKEEEEGERLLAEEAEERERRRLEGEERVRKRAKEEGYGYG